MNYLTQVIDIFILKTGGGYWASENLKLTPTLVL